MAKNKYEIARGNYAAPPSPSTKEEKRSYVSKSSEISAETAQRFLNSMRDIMDERINRRIRTGQDIPKVYTARITVMDTENEEAGKVSIDDTEIPVYRTVPVSVKAEYNDTDEVEIKNNSVRILPDVNVQWCKICTYDGVEFFVLHRI